MEGAAPDAAVDGATSIHRLRDPGTYRGHAAEAVLALCGLAMVLGSFLPWAVDENGRNVSGWGLFLEFGPLWDQASVGWADASGSVPTGPVIAAAGMALVGVAAFHLRFGSRAPKSVVAWVVALLASIVGAGALLAEVYDSAPFGAVLSASAGLVAPVALAAGLVAIGWRRRRLGVARATSAPARRVGVGLLVLALPLMAWAFTSRFVDEDPYGSDRAAGLAVAALVVGIPGALLVVLNRHERSADDGPRPVG